MHNVIKNWSFKCFYWVIFFFLIWNTSRICMSSLCRGHANLLCIIPILAYVLPKRALLCDFLSKDNLSWALGLVATVRFALLSTTLLHHFSPQTLPCLPCYRPSLGSPPQMAHETMKAVLLWAHSWLAPQVIFYSSFKLVGWVTMYQGCKGERCSQMCALGMINSAENLIPMKPNSSKCAWLTSPRSQVWRPLSSYVERGIKNAYAKHITCNSSQRIPLLFTISLSS